MVGRSTPLPKKAMVAVVLLNMTAGFQWNIIFPFIPFMVEELRETTEGTGLYVGILAASYHLGQFIASFIWPPLSDSLGRKKMLILGQVGLLVPFVFFGGAQTYAQALVARTFNGLLQQNFVLSQAMIADLTDSSNQALGASAMAFSWGAANVMAPVLGGLLARPAEKFPQVFGTEGFWTRFPYLLPPLVLLGWGIVAVVAGMAWLPPDKLSVAAAARKLCFKSGQQRYTAVQTDEDADGSESEHSRHSNDSCPRRYFSIVCGREYRLVIACRWLIPMTWVVYNEFFPLFAKVPTHQGGLGWEPTQIGVMLSVSGIVMLVFQPLAFPPLTRRLGAVRLHTRGCIGFTLCILCLPLISPLAEIGSESSWKLWLALVIQTTLLNCTGASVAGSASLLLINVAAANEQGRVQGVGGGLMFLAMMISPAVGGAIWTFSLANLSWPLFPVVPYAFVAAIGVVMTILSSRLPRELDTPRRERDAVVAAAVPTKPRP